MLSLLLLLLISTEGGAVIVDGEHINRVFHPSTRCQNHARAVCKEVPSRQLGSVQETLSSKCVGQANLCPNTSCKLNSTPFPVHFQYQYRDNSQYDLVLTWKPLNESCVTAYHILIMVKKRNEDYTCDRYGSCPHGVFSLPTNSTQLVVPGFTMGNSTLNPFAFKVVAFPAYEWPEIIVKQPIRNDPDLSENPFASSETCNEFNCAQVPTPPSNLTVTEIPEAAAVNVSWESSLSIAHYYLHLRTPSTKLLFVVKNSNNFVTVKHFTENGSYCVWLETYACGCSHNTTSKVHFYINRDPSGPSPTIISSPSGSPHRSPPPISTPHKSGQVISTSSLTPPPMSMMLPSATGTDHLPVGLEPGVVAAVTVVAVLITASLLVVVAGIVGMAMVHQLRNKETKPGYKDSSIPSSSTQSSSLLLPPPPPPLPPPPPPFAEVVLVYAPDTPKSEEEVIVALSYQMKTEGINAVCYDVACRLDRVRWLELATSSAQAVFCIVNEQFLNGWGSETEPILSALHLLITADIKQRGAQGGSKFAVLLLRPSDRQFIPKGYMLTLQEFLVTELRDIIRYTRCIPEYSSARN